MDDKLAVCVSHRFANPVEVLEAVGYRPLEAEVGPSGLRLLEQQPAIDLLVTDVACPGA